MARCLAPPPGGAAGLIAGLALAPGRKVPYREEVTHPALSEPEIATGTVFIAGNGDLVRDQARPERQISEIGETLLSTRTAPDGEPTLYPIPEDARPMLLALRRALAGDAEGVAADFEIDLAADDAGWRLALRPRDDAAASIVLGGCGGALRTVEIAEPDGVRRSMTFFPER